LLQLYCHHPHLGINVVEELAVTGTEVIQPGLTIGRDGVTILGTATVADEAYLAALAVTRQGGFLLVTELELVVTVG
jgi:hypothetical protein